MDILAQHFLLQPVLILLALLKCCQSKCIHDQLSSTSSGQQESQDIFIMRDANKYRWRRDRVAKDNTLPEEKYKPLRIHLHYSQDTFLIPDEQGNLRQALAQAVHRISSVLSVIPIASSPVLLPRVQACAAGATFFRGINGGKCSRLAKGYKGEMCMGIFKLPYIHLQGFSVYNSSSPEPVFTIKPGTGVDNTDLIIYVTTIDAPICLAHNGSVTAFASHCQVDTTGRPVAGLINFCPFALKRAALTQQFLYTTSLHEILHVLGFSTKLFGAFKHCKDGACYKLEDAVQQENGQWRLVTTAVVNKTRHHFRCFTQDNFGAALQAEDSQMTSHWDSASMYTSVMTATNKENAYAVLDPITLAALEDSGWYKVNYANADTFLWGRGSGCSFGQTESCQLNSKYFCSSNTSGCHFLLRSKGICEGQSNGKQCGVYTSQESCTDVKNGNGHEIFSASSRCFLSSISLPSQQDEDHFVGRCYNRRCSKNGGIFVQIQGTDWIPCPTSQTIQMKGLQGEIKCPQNSDIVCTEWTDFTTRHEQTSQKQVLTSTRTSTMKFHTTPATASNRRNCADSRVASSRHQLCLVSQFMLIFRIIQFFVTEYITL